MSFDEQLRRAQEQRRAEAASAGSRETQMLSLGSSIYDEVCDAGRHAFRVLVNAGALVVRAHHDVLPGASAVLLDPRRSERANGIAGVYLLDSGHPVTASGWATTQGGFSRRRRSAPELEHVLAIEVRIVQTSPSFELWSFRPSPADPTGLVVDCNLAETNLRILYHEFGLVRPTSVTEYIAAATAERQEVLAQERG